jgi:hypothetical protein
MDLLRFTDRNGRPWEVWEVRARPAVADRPTPTPLPAPDRWLCFESGTERRRLVTYPRSWRTMSASGLDAMCRAATPVRATPRIDPSRASVEHARPVDAEAP